jgi:hypothetical protein
MGEDVFQCDANGEDVVKFSCESVCGKNAARDSVEWCRGDFIFWDACGRRFYDLIPGLDDRNLKILALSRIKRFNGRSLRGLFRR